MNYCILVPLTNLCFAVIEEPFMIYGSHQRGPEPDRAPLITRAMLTERTAICIYNPHCCETGRA